MSPKTVCALNVPLFLPFISSFLISFGLFLAFYLEAEFLPLSLLSICLHTFILAMLHVFMAFFFHLSFPSLFLYPSLLLPLLPPPTLLSPSADPGRSLMDFSVSILLDSSKNNSLSYLHRGVMYTKLRWFVMSYITLYGIEWVYHYAATRRL